MTSNHLNTEAQPRFWKLFAFSVLPVALAVAVGLWLSSRIHNDPEVQAQNQRTEEVIAQDRLLVDALWSAIETIKTRALSLEQVRDAQLHGEFHQATSMPEGPILHWAELEVKDGKLAAVRQSARNPLFLPAAGADVFESYYLQAALSRLNLHELQENGVTVLRIKQDSGRSQEWLALGFSGEGPNAASRPVVLALVDPAEVFPIFRRWTARSEGGNLRGYLVGSDGFVIVHSQHPYVASDFGPTQVFAQGVREMMRGRIRSGAGVYKAIDQVLVTAAYARPGTLPLGAVVERVNPKAEPKAALASIAFALARAPGEACVALACVFALALGLSVAAHRLLRRALFIRGAVNESLAASSSMAASSSTEIHEQIQDEIQPEGPPQARTGLTQAERVETALIEDLLSDQAGSRASQLQRSERVLLAQFETEVRNVQDPKIVAQSLAETAAKLTGAPALFFSYHETLRACLLLAHAGLPQGTSTEALSFRLTDSMLGRIARYQKEGRTASVADDPNLALLLAKRLGGSRCEAWPVIGQGGKLLGVLAVLGSGPAQSQKTDSLDQIMKVSASLFNLSEEA